MYNVKIIVCIEILYMYKISTFNFKNCQISNSIKCQKYHDLCYSKEPPDFKTGNVVK